VSERKGEREERKVPDSLYQYAHRVMATGGADNVAIIRTDIDSPHVSVIFSDGQGKMVKLFGGRPPTFLHQQGNMTYPCAPVGTLHSFTSSIRLLYLF